MKKTTRLAAALLAAFTLAAQIPASAEPTNYTILDSYNGNGVPTGTSYQELEYYNQYVDAGSVDASPFVIDKTTANSGGILFYGSTELISAANANTFRLTSTTGAFDFTSFNLQDLESNQAYGTNTIPTMTVTASTGFTQTWSASALPPPSDPGPVFYSFDDSGVKTMNLSGVDWVDFTTQYTKAKTSDFVLTAGARPSGSFGDLAIGTTAVTAPNSTVAEVSGTATVNVDSTGTTISNVTGGTVNVKGANTTIQSYNGGNVGVDRGLTVAMNDGNSSGVISGGGGMTKNSAGTLTLGGVNTYTGATTVGGGLLVVNGSIASSPVTIQSGGTLGGSGAVGALTVESGGTINPGNSPGTLNIHGDIDWLGGGNYNWQIAGVTGTAGSVSTWDLISATGVLDLSALNIGSKFNINLWSLQSTGPDVNGAVAGFNNTQNYTWKIATAAGGITNFSSSYFNLNAGAINGAGGFVNGLNGGTFSLAQSGNDLNLVFTSAGGAPVPEPGTWAAAALLVGGAAFMRWRKRAKVA